MPTGIFYPYPWLNSLVHLQRRCVPSRHEPSLLAKEGTMFNFASKSAISERARFFYMPHSWDMGQIILLPHPKEGMLRIFPTGKIRRLRSGANPRSWVSHCVNQMGKTQYKFLAAWHGRGMAWYVWISPKSHATGIQAMASSARGPISLLQWIMAFVGFYHYFLARYIIVLRTGKSLLPTGLTTRNTNLSRS
jgi:hypothetical protein